MKNEPNTILTTLQTACPGQKVRGYYVTESGASAFPSELGLAFGERPWVLYDRVNPLYYIWRNFVVIDWIGSGKPRWKTSATLPHGSERRARYFAKTKEEYRHFGDWNSLAGHMLTGLQGRARCLFQNHLVVTDEELLIVALSDNEKHAQITFRVPLADVPWTRSPHHQKDRIQFGFSDGSWHTAKVVRTDHRSPKFLEVLPDTLPHTAQLPDVLAETAGGGD
ncbi:hypothetical protein ACIREE_36670 [Streptomyces sp. NPDC102467]|uniref:hypothetical protein n=1 Tax=Streptomyces sp. NPDC102467 TaxID=3366179 RepID=UPI00382B6976